MAYRKGMLKLVDPPCAVMTPDGRCPEPHHTHAVGDYRDAHDRQFPCAYLPHPQDAWVIGGPEEIRALMADLHEALQHMGQRG
jgi:hypothetical protein